MMMTGMWDSEEWRDGTCYAVDCKSSGWERKEWHLPRTNLMPVTGKVF